MPGRCGICAQYVTSQPFWVLWPPPQDIQFKAKKIFCCTDDHFQTNDTKPTDGQICVHSLCFQASLHLRSVFALNAVCNQCCWLLHLHFGAVGGDVADDGNAGANHEVPDDKLGGWDRGVWGILCVFPHTAWHSVTVHTAMTMMMEMMMTMMKMTIVNIFYESRNRQFLTGLWQK